MASDSKEEVARLLGVMSDEDRRTDKSAEATVQVDFEIELVENVVVAEPATDLPNRDACAPCGPSVRRRRHLILHI